MFTALSLGLVFSTKAEIWMTGGDPSSYESSALPFASCIIVGVGSLAVLAVYAPSSNGQECGHEPACRSNHRRSKGDVWTVRDLSPSRHRARAARFSSHGQPPHARGNGPKTLAVDHCVAHNNFNSCRLARQPRASPSAV